MVPGDARPPGLPHLLRPRRPRSAFVPSADASRGCSFSSLLQKVPLGVGAALPAISSRVVCSPITQQTPAIARGALASMAHVLGQVSLPYGAGPLATPTAAHEDASDGLHHGSPRSTLDAVRESFLKIWIKSCDFLLEIFHWFFSLLVKNSKLPWHQSSCPLCLCPHRQAPQNLWWSLPPHFHRLLLLMSASVLGDAHGGYHTTPFPGAVRAFASL